MFRRRYQKCCCMNNNSNCNNNVIEDKCENVCPCNYEEYNEDQCECGFDEEYEVGVFPENPMLAQVMSHGNLWIRHLSHVLV